MAGVRATAQTGEVVVTTGVAKTALQVVAPSAQRLSLRGVQLTIKTASPSGKTCLVELLRQTTAGTMSALTPVALSPAAATVRAAAQHTATAEPTAGDVLRRWEVVAPGYEVQIPPDLAIEVAESGRLGVRVTPQEDGSVVAGLTWEE